MPEAFHGVPVTEEITIYTRGRLYQGQLSVHGAGSFDTLRHALVAEYGAPAFANSATHMFSWSWPDSPIKVRLYLTDDTTTVDMVNRAI